MLAYMEFRKEQAKKVLDKYLEALADPEKIDRQKLEIEPLKLESQIKDNQPEEDRALNSVRLEL